MYLTKDDFASQNLGLGNELIIKCKNEDRIDIIRQILSNQEKAEKWNNHIKLRESVSAPLSDKGQLFIKNQQIVENIEKRIEELRTLLKNKELTSEESMELQYWLRENIHALEGK